MNAAISFAQTRLSYPIFDADFDPYNRGYLVVGGGGGESRSGIANKLVRATTLYAPNSKLTRLQSLLDVSSHGEVSVVSELELSSNEDSPQTIQSIATKDGVVAIAGVNSSAADQQAGRNEHFRTYNVPFPPRKKGDNENEEKGTGLSITALGQASIFRPSTAVKKQTYQRLLRLTRPRSREAGSKRLGAMATGFAPEAEIVIFDASKTPDTSSVRGHINLKKGDDANDLDIVEHKEGHFGLVYCTDYEVYLHAWTYDFSNKTSKHASEEPQVIYSVPTAQKAGGRPVVRCLRWLSPKHILLAVNTANKKGGELLVLRLSSSDSPGKITVRKNLPRSIKSTVCLATCPLDADPGSGDRQTIVAVAGQDRSIHIFSLDYSPSTPSQISKFTHYKSLDDVHPLAITKITFNNFFTPIQPPHSTMSIATMPQYVRLASVSMSNNVVIDTLSLTSTPTKPHDTADASTAKLLSPSVRWVLSSAGTELLRSWTGILVISFVVFVTAFLLQSYVNTTGNISTTMRSFMPAGARSNLSAISEAVEKRAGAAVNGVDKLAHRVKNELPEIVSHEAVDASSAIREAVDYATSGVPSIVSHEASAVRSTVSRASPIAMLRDLLSRLRHHDEADSHAIVVHDAPSGLTAEVVEGAVDVAALRSQGAKKFEELPKAERERWKRVLADAGQWTVAEGETVLKSVFFSQVAEVVGGAVRDAVLH